MMTILAVSVTETISLPMLTALATAVGVIGKTMLDSWRGSIRAKADMSRVQQVDVPQAQAQGWVEMFTIVHDATLRLTGDVAKLEKRLDDQDEEHRLELAERDARYRVLAQLQSDTAGSLRRLRSYVVIVTNLLNEHGIAFPPMPDEDGSPERRTPMTVTVLGEDLKQSVNIDSIKE